MRQLRSTVNLFEVIKNSCNIYQRKTNRSTGLRGQKSCDLFQTKIAWKSRIYDLFNVKHHEEWRRKRKRNTVKNRYIPYPLWTDKSQSIPLDLSVQHLFISPWRTEWWHNISSRREELVRRQSNINHIKHHRIEEIGDDAHTYRRRFLIYLTNTEYLVSKSIVRSKKLRSFISHQTRPDASSSRTFARKHLTQFTQHHNNNIFDAG